VAALPGSRGLGGARLARGWRFEVETTTPTQRDLIAQHFGARRFAYNWALAQVKANLDARTADPSVPALPWTLRTIRKAWNQAKPEVAPWWPCCSKEAYACGIADLVTALHAWSASKQGRRAGSRGGFPRFKARHRDRGRVRFTTNPIRLEADRRQLTLPVIGTLRSKENTRRLQRLIAKGRARVLSMTLSEQSGRLCISVATVVAQTPRQPREPSIRCGIDLGIGADWAVIAHADDTIERVAPPAPWAGMQQQRRRITRRLSRRVVGSRGHRQARAKLAALDRRAANLRRESIHISPPGWRAATARSWSRTSTLPRWPRAWGGGRSDAACTRSGSGKSAPPWPTRPAGQAAGWLSRTDGFPPPRPITAAAATTPTSG
jgi:putative transposase